MASAADDLIAMACSLAVHIAFNVCRSCMQDLNNASAPLIVSGQRSGIPGFYLGPYQGFPKNGSPCERSNSAEAQRNHSWEGSLDTVC